MAKTPSDKLFRLVKSLTPAEKRYFRLYVRGDSKYLQLFEALSDMTTPDDEALKASIYQKQPPESRKYSELKSYLYELLLKSLQQYDEGQSVEYRLNHLLQSVAVLFKRGHYQDCRERLVKAARMARQYERFTQLLEVIAWEKQLAYTRMDADFFHRELDRLQYEETHALEQMENAAAYRRAFFSVYATVKREAQLRGSASSARLQSLVSQDLFDHPDRALSHKARVMYYRTLNLYYYAVLDRQAFYDSGRQLIDLLESQSHFLKENLSDYIAALSNFILSCGLLGRYHEVRQTLLLLRRLQPITEDDRRKIHRQYYANHFALCIYTGAFEEARQEMAQCQEEALAFDQHDYETASFYFQYSCICFGCGDFNGALDYLNEWLNQPRTVEREDLQSLARILSLIIHYELGNTVLLESLLRAATRFLKKKNRLFDLERRFFHLFTDLLKLPPGRGQIIAFEAARAGLHELNAQPEAQALLQTLDLDAWLESRITGQTFAAVVRANWEQRSLRTT
jgi:hypothetical protein